MSSFPEAKFAIGNVVDYHSVIDEGVTEASMVIRQVGRIPSSDNPVYWLEGKAGCVVEAALTPAIVSQTEPLEPERPPVCWGFADDERLEYEIGEVMERWVDNAHPTPIKELAAHVTLTGFARRRTVPADISVLDYALEQLDEKYGSPDYCDPAEPTDAMKAAEAEFVSVLLREYEVWQCEPVCTVTVDVQRWLREYRPDLLEVSP